MKEIWLLFITFLKIGTFVFGGGYAMIPAIRRETVETRGWLDEAGILDCIAICQSLPGAFAVNTAVYIGKQVKGIAGALAACLGITLPAFASILAIVIFLGKIEDNVYISGAIEGIRAASVGLILVTMFQLGSGILKNGTGYLIAIASFALIVFFEINAIYAILFGGLVGFIEFAWRSRGKGERS